MNNRLWILASPYFLSGLVILLLNDFVLKEAWGNRLTGKLSDFAGLFIFPLFWTALFPRVKKVIFIGTAIAFLFWKSPLSQSFLDFWNALGILPLARVVDPSDLIALSVLPLAYTLEKDMGKGWKINIHPVFPLFIALFAFCATSYMRDFEYNKTYDFPFSKKELANRMNSTRESRGADNLPLSVDLPNANDHQMRGKDTLWFFVSDTTSYLDTLYKGKEQKKIDTIIQHRIPNRDTMYPDRSGFFYYSIPARKYMPESKSGYCETVECKLRIQGDGNQSSLTLLKIRTSNCMGMFEGEAEDKEKGNLLGAFEGEIIDQLMK